jgi:uncharacterized membrane protein
MSAIHVVGKIIRNSPNVFRNLKLYFYVRAVGVLFVTSQYVLTWFAVTWKTKGDRKVTLR